MIVMPHRPAIERITRCYRAPVCREPLRSKNLPARLNPRRHPAKVQWLEGPARRNHKPKMFRRPSCLQAARSSRVPEIARPPEQSSALVEGQSWPQPRSGYVVLSNAFVFPRLLGYSEFPHIYMTELRPREVTFPVSVRRHDDRLHFAVEEGFTVAEAHRPASIAAFEQCDSCPLSVTPDFWFLAGDVAQPCGNSRPAQHEQCFSFHDCFGFNVCGGSSPSHSAPFRRRAMRFGFFGRPPSFPFSRELRAFAGVETLPMSAPTLISFPQCGQGCDRSAFSFSGFLVSMCPVPPQSGHSKAAVTSMMVTGTSPLPWHSSQTSDSTRATEQSRCSEPSVRRSAESPELIVLMA